MSNPRNDAIAAFKVVCDEHNEMWTLLFDIDERLNFLTGHDDLFRRIDSILLRHTDHPLGVPVA